MNNEPVAWISEYTLKNCLQGNLTDEVRATTKETTNCTIPLYTHPVKQLSDEEIEKIADYCLFVKENSLVKSVGGYFNFYRTIIKEITE